MCCPACVVARQVGVDGDRSDFNDEPSLGLSLTSEATFQHLQSVEEAERESWLG